MGAMKRFYLFHCHFGVKFFKMMFLAARSCGWLVSTNGILSFFSWENNTLATREKLPGNQTRLKRVGNLASGVPLYAVPLRADNRSHRLPHFYFFSQCTSGRYPPNPAIWLVSGAGRIFLSLTTVMVTARKPLNENWKTTYFGWTREIFFT